MKAKFFFLFIIIFSSSFTQASTFRGLWVWDTKSVISSSTETNILINQCIADGTSDIYLYAYAMLTGTDKSNMQNFVQLAQCNKIKVWAMDGSRGYFADWYGRSYFTDFINSVIAYNNSSSDNQKFVGIHSDNEPQDNQGEPLSSFHDGFKDSSLNTTSGGVWKTSQAEDREYLMQDWIGMTQQAYVACHANGMKYGQSMVSWLDDYYGEPVYCTYNNQRKKVMQHIMPYLDDYCIMTYNTNTANVLNRVQGELAYAESLPATSRPRIWLSGETHCGVGAQVSYCDTPGKNTKNTVYSDIATIEASASKFTCYAGYNVHDWEGWKALSPTSSNATNPSCPTLAKTSFKNNSNEKKVNIYPNPSKGQIIISNCKPNTIVEIATILGKIIYSEKINEPEYVIKLSQLPGIYLVKITSDDYVQYEKIILE
jgi:Secretion system C-terminal sorting domain